VLVLAETTVATIALPSGPSWVRRRRLGQYGAVASVDRASGEVIGAYPTDPSPDPR
jgi:hypothetical protein